MYLIGDSCHASRTKSSFSVALCTVNICFKVLWPTSSRSARQLNRNCKVTEIYTVCTTQCGAKTLILANIAFSLFGWMSFFFDPFERYFYDRQKGAWCWGEGPLVPACHVTKPNLTLFCPSVPSTLAYNYSYPHHHIHATSNPSIHSHEHLSSVSFTCNPAEQKRRGGQDEDLQIFLYVYELFLFLWSHLHITLQLLQHTHTHRCSSIFHFFLGPCMSTNTSMRFLFSLGHNTN